MQFYLLERHKINVICRPPSGLVVCRSADTRNAVPFNVSFPCLQDVMSDSSVEEFMLGMASQLAEREDAVLCSDVRDKLFGPNEFSRRDLGALNIMRGRDNGLADYNTVVDEHFNGPNAIKVVIDMLAFTRSERISNCPESRNSKTSTKKCSKAILNWRKIWKKFTATWTTSTCTSAAC